MREVPLNKEARLHRLLNQRRIAYALIERARTLLKPGVPFNRELHELFRSQGKFGSRDRRLYRELIYTYLRYQPWLDPDFKQDKAFMDNLVRLAAPTAEIASLYPTLPEETPPELPADQRHRALGRSDHELAELLPGWYAAHSNRPHNNRSLLALVTRPPLWLRVQSDPRGDLIDQLRAAASDAQARQIVRHPSVPDCIHAPADFSVSDLPCYQNGQVEIQDISSQILLQLLRDRPQGSWLDACAGAGGKTLQLAKALQPFGKAFAYDPRPSATRELKARVKRSGLRNVSIADHRPTSGQYDGVLVDAPCSGSGTWRRHPYLMRQTREQDIFEHAATQLSILKTYAPLVRPGGALVYCTCSLSRYENESVAQKLLAALPEFQPLPLASRFGYEDRGHGVTLYPEDHNGDGLYIASFRRRA